MVILLFPFLENLVVTYTWWGSACMMQVEKFTYVLLKEEKFTSTKYAHIISCSI